MPPARDTKSIRVICPARTVCSERAALFLESPRLSRVRDRQEQTRGREYLLRCLIVAWEKRAAARARERILHSAGRYPPPRWSFSLFRLPSAFPTSPSSFFTLFISFLPPLSFVVFFPRQCHPPLSSSSSSALSLAA